MYVPENESGWIPSTPRSKNKLERRDFEWYDLALGGDGGDARFNDLLRKKPIQSPNALEGDVIEGSKSGLGLLSDIYSHKHSTPKFARYDESDVNDDTFKYGCSICNKSIQSKMSSPSKMSSSNDDSLLLPVYSSGPLQNDLQHNERNERDIHEGHDNIRMNGNRTKQQQLQINIIVFLGLVIGVLASKAFQCLYYYFNWFQNQVVKLRDSFLGPYTMWELINRDDTSNYTTRTKIIILPLIAATNLLYILILILLYSTRFMLTRAPTCMTSFVQKLHIDA